MTHCQRILDLLADGREHSYREGYALGVMLHSRAADLRRKGYRIEVRRDGDDYLYRLVSGPALNAGEDRNAAAVPPLSALSVGLDERGTTIQAQPDALFTLPATPAWN